MARHVSQAWLKSCTEELDLPGSPWHEVKERISKYLVERIRIEGLRKDELAKVRYLLGREFASKFKLAKSEASRDLARPNHSDEKLERLLKDLTLKAAKDARCFPKNDIKESPKAFQDVVALVTEIVESSLNSYMRDTKGSLFTQYGSNTSVITLSTFVDKDIEILGEAVVKILQKEPARLENMCERLRGRMLPVAPRRLIYRLSLINKKKQSRHPGRNLGVGVLSHDDDITQQGLRETFAKGLKKGLQDLKSEDPAKSPLQHLIHLAVIEAYESLPGLNPHSGNMEIQKECSTVLNILYTFSKKFERNYILWLFPLQVTINQDRYAKEHSYELAMWLNCIMTSCINFDAKSLNARTLNVWEKCFSGNLLFKKYLSDHLRKIGVKCDKESVEKVLRIGVLSGKDSNLYGVLGSTSYDLSSKSSDSLFEATAGWTVSHPALCLRQWLSQLFVGVTNFPVTMYIWDQFFLHSWEPSVMDVACCSLLYAMSDILMLSSDIESLCADMLEQTVNVKLHEMHRAWGEISPKLL